MALGAGDIRLHPDARGGGLHRAARLLGGVWRPGTGSRSRSALVVAVGVFRPFRSGPICNRSGPRLADQLGRAPVSTRWQTRSLAGRVPVRTEPREPRPRLTSMNLHQGGLVPDCRDLDRLACFSVVFWTGFEQSGGTMNLFADENTNRNHLRHTISGFHLPGYQSGLHHHPGSGVRRALDLPRDARNFPSRPSVSKQGLGFDLPRGGLWGHVPAPMSSQVKARSRHCG